MFENDSKSDGGYVDSLGAIGSAQNVDMLPRDALNEGGSHIILFDGYFDKDGDGVDDGVNSEEQTPWNAQRKVEYWTWGKLRSYRPIRRINLEEKPTYEARWISQTQPEDYQNLDNDEYFDVLLGDEVVVTAVFENVGSTTWYNTGEHQVAINIYKDPNVISYPSFFEYIPGVQESFFEHSSWIDPYRVATMQEAKSSSWRTGYIYHPVFNPG